MHMQKAAQLGTSMKHDHVTSDHIPLLKVHINKTVRENTTPSVQGFKDHIIAHHARKADKVKSDAAVSAMELKLKKDMATVELAIKQQELEIKKQQLEISKAELALEVTQERPVKIGND